MQTILEQYGLQYIHREEYADYLRQNTFSLLGRVISVHRTQYTLITEQGMVDAEITGNRLKDKDPYIKPIVGDWVIFRHDTQHDTFIIEHICKRASLLERKKPHKDKEVQLIAANVDTAFVVQSVVQDFNPKRLQRVLLQLADAGVTPVVVFHKIDLAESLDEIHALRDTLMNQGILVILSSLVTGQGMTELHEHLKPQETIVIMGSSGVGKSSLINHLLGDDSEKVGEISSYSGKGKHTTTARKMMLLPNGTLVIDTPGTREFGITVDDEEPIRENFAVITELAQGCKFRNCKHISEPDCAVQGAIQEGSLDQKVLDSYHKLLKEVQKK